MDPLIHVLMVSSGGADEGIPAVPSASVGLVFRSRSEK